jgi:hypothetical protein
MFTTLDDVPAIMASRPVNEDTAPLPRDPSGARIVPAREVETLDLILAGVHERPGGYVVDWFNEGYEAFPRAFDPACGCGVCCLADPADGEHVVLTDDDTNGPWVACDPWVADGLVLIIPA